MSTPSQVQIDAALDQLSSKYLSHPQVSLIDYGLSFEKSKSRTPSLRIHVRSNVHETEFPKEIDGIPVSLVQADYRLE
jgi:hypothetical protein